MSAPRPVVPLADIRIAVLSRVGGRERNEDACGYWNQGGPVCCVLSDGAGGHGGGDVASRIAVETILHAYAENPARSPQDILRLIKLANAEVIREQSRADSQRDMRATLVLLSFDPDSGEAVWGHIGDSRLYLFRGGYLSARTKDHSLVQSMIDAGFVDPAKLRTGPDRSVLIASLGGEDGFEPDVTETPAILNPGDAFILCSDGFWEHLTDRAMEAALQRVASPEQWLSSLEQIVLSAARPGQDNYTAVAVWFGAMDFTTMSAPRAGA